ncbi:ABC transporter permease [Promicromonospora sp. NPDC023987]|uniref:ABC transporter permease n=1 Tax=Promicromonospora sp. NPDC023987 TaxID=3155360 RepID=UPI0033F503EA
MSATVTAPRGPASGTTVGQTPVKNVSFWRVLRSEWIKLWTLRSTWWTLGPTVVVMVGFAFAMALVAQFIGDQMADAGPEAEAAGAGGMIPGTLVVAFGFETAALVVAVLGSMIITGEYSTGMIRSTFAAVPDRLTAFFAKATVLAGVTAVLTAVSLAIAWAVTYPILDANSSTVDFSDGTQVRQLGGVVLYVVLVALFSLGIGALLRHTAGAIFTVVALFFVVPTIFTGAAAFASDIDWVVWVTKLLPSVAGAQITPTAGAVPDALDPWVGISVLAGYTVLVLAGAATRLKLQDA